MDDVAAVFKAFDGGSKLADLMNAPPSTVFSWLKSGIPKSRMAHIRLIAEQRGINLPPGVA